MVYLRLMQRPPAGGGPANHPEVCREFPWGRSISRIFCVSLMCDGGFTSLVLVLVCLLGGGGPEGDGGTNMMCFLLLVVSMLHEKRPAFI